MCIYVYLFCLSMYIYIYLSLSSFIYNYLLYSYVSILSYLILSVDRSVYLSIYLSVCLSIYLAIYLSIYVSIYLSMYLSLYLSLSISISILSNPILCNLILFIYLSLHYTNKKYVQLNVCCFCHLFHTSFIRMQAQLPLSLWRWATCPAGETKSKRL